jgi:hypothetical protein
MYTVILFYMHEAITASVADISWLIIDQVIIIDECGILEN